MTSSSRSTNCPTGGGVTRNRAFASWVAINFYNVDEDEALESAGADGGNDQGIDIIFADENSQEILALQAHCPVNCGKKTPKNKWDAALSSISYIRNHESLRTAGRLDLYEIVDQLKSKYPDYGLSIGLVSSGLHSPEISHACDTHKKDLSYKDVGLFYLGQEEILAKYGALVEAESGVPEDELNFSGNYFKDTGDYGRAWIGSVSAAELKRLYGAHGDRLFAGNVRLFLGSRKGGINEQIIKTAKEEPGNFWALNNGITVVADNVDIIDSSKILLKRFSVVNGCQTTSSLVKADAGNSAKVLARVIAAKAGLKNEIVRYNNSQNAVKIWTVRAVDDIQEQLRRDFAETRIIYAPKQSGARKRKDINTIELDRVTQYLAASEQKYLIQAIDNKSELFDEPYQKLFHKGIRAGEVLLAWITGSLSEEERLLLHGNLGSDKNSGLLSVTSVYWIIFTTYKLFEKFGNLDFTKAKLERLHALEFSNAVRKYTKKATELYYDAAIDTYEREEYGSIKSTLRSTKFLQKLDSKLNSKITRITRRELPDLSAVLKSAKT